MADSAYIVRGAYILFPRHPWDALGGTAFDITSISACSNKNEHPCMILKLQAAH
jgi:hypothetical protein